MTVYSWVYIVLSEDRHSGVDATPYRVEADAIEAAYGIAKANASYPEDIHEEQLNRQQRDDGWIIDIHYSIEDDTVCVLKRRLK